MPRVSFTSYYFNGENLEIWKTKLCGYPDSQLFFLEHILPYSLMHISPPHENNIKLKFLHYVLSSR